MKKVQLIDVCKVYKGNVRAVSDFNLNIDDGEFIVFVGPSGCGKSTTLRMIAGLEEITSGKIYIDDKLVNNMEPKDRDIAMVFQNYALYPHMSVFDNLAYSLKCHHEKKEIIKEKVNNVANLLNIHELLERKPKELSGGQRQRVALGRCLIRNPKVFLFDEPLSNLDAKLRVQMRSEISKLHKQVKGTFIYVTHDQTEAMTMGDRIVVMKDGFIQQIDTPINLYEHPINVFVATFLGSPQMNMFKVHLKNEELIFDDKTKLKLSEKIINKMIDGYQDEELVLGIRPSDFVLGSEDDFDFCVNKIELIEKLGNETLLYVSLPGKDDNTIISLKLDMLEELTGPIYLKVNKDKIHLFNTKEESILRINDLNYISTKFSFDNHDVIINEKYRLNNFVNKAVDSNILGVDKGYIQIPSSALSLKKEREDDLELKVEIVAKDIRSNTNVYFARLNKTDTRITFITSKEQVYKNNEQIILYAPINSISICDDEKNVLTITDDLIKPILDFKVKQIGKDYYVITDEKTFAKTNKYFLVKKIYDLNTKMLLSVTNQKDQEFTLRVDKNKDFFTGMILYIKKEKIIK